MLKRTAVLSFLLWLMAAPLWAAEALVGLYLDDSPADAMRVVYKDAEHFRVDLLADDKVGSFILVDGKRRWLAERDYTRRLWEVFDLDMVLAVFGPEPGDKSETEGDETIVFTAVGVQTVNGFTGETYSVQSGSGDFKLVLCEDADAVAITRAWASVVKDLGESETAVFLNALEYIGQQNQAEYGLLKYDGKLILKSIRRMEYSDNYFELPRDREIIGPPGLMDED